MALTLCLEAGCPNLVKRGRCPEHRRRPRRKNQTYSTHQWRTTRARYLTTHPTSLCCGAPTEDVDHIIPRRILQAAGIHNPDADRWLQPLCKRHHSVKTATIDTPMLRRLNAGEPPEALAQEAEGAAQAWLTTLHTSA